MRLLAIVLLSLLHAGLSNAWAASGGEACLKQVFGEYCLGGSMQQLLQRQPNGMRSQQSRERSAVVYPQGREHTYVMAYQGRIYKILHTFEPTSRIKLKELRESLELKYGVYRDRSHYPGYARTLASKIGAIRRGEGELSYVWQSPGGEWNIELTWTRELGIALAYLAKELNLTQLQAMERGL
jgi:hypothetical protein